MSGLIMRCAFADNQQNGNLSVHTNAEGAALLRSSSRLGALFYKAPLPPAWFSSALKAEISTGITHTRPNKKNISFSSQRSHGSLSVGLPTSQLIPVAVSAAAVSCSFKSVKGARFFLGWLIKQRNGQGVQRTADIAAEKHKHFE